MSTSATSSRIERLCFLQNRFARFFNLVGIWTVVVFMPYKYLTKDFKGTFSLIIFDPSNLVYQLQLLPRRTISLDMTLAA